MFDRTRFAISRLREIELAQFGLTIEQSSILHILTYYKNSATAKELETWTMRQHHSVSALLNGMRERGLIKKFKTPGEKRSKIVLTEKGRELFSKVSITSMDLSFSTLSPEETQQFAVYLRKLLRGARHSLGISDEKTDWQDSMNRSAAKASVIEAITVRELWPLLERTGFAISRLRELELAHSGLTIEQSAILHILSSYGGSATARELEDITMRRQNSVSSLIKGMTKMGLVEKKKETNERRFSIVITSEGKILFQAVSTTSLDTIFSTLTAGDQERFTEYLKTLLEKARYLLGIPYQNPLLLYLNSGGDEKMVK